MMTAYKLTRAARRDLQEIADYWTVEAGEKPALKVVRCGGNDYHHVHLSKSWAGGRPFRRTGSEICADKYMVYYRPYSKGIEILQVFHGTRDQSKAWPKKPGKQPLELNLRLLT